jgi:hypothetical protein
MNKICNYVLMISVISLGGCAPKWDRPNTSEAVFFQDRYQCEQQAAITFPPVMVQKATSPGFQAAASPTQTNCTSQGNQISCRSAQVGLDSSVFNRPPQYVTEDANISNRFSLIRSCLNSKGYTRQ